MLLEPFFQPLTVGAGEKSALARLVDDSRVLDVTRALEERERRER